ncbi:MAG TPA: hypothetical protein PK159_01830, partial [Steroidobacteraceae bacterium]|nr:hypothetical protein [Steroidobacteraceae bacterium]
MARSGWTYGDRPRRRRSRQGRTRGCEVFWRARSPAFTVGWRAWKVTVGDVQSVAPRESRITTEAAWLPRST